MNLDNIQSNQDQNNQPLLNSDRSNLDRSKVLDYPNSSQDLPQTKKEIPKQSKQTLEQTQKQTLGASFSNISSQKIKKTSTGRGLLLKSILLVVLISFLVGVAGGFTGFFLSQSVYKPSTEASQTVKDSNLDKAGDQQTKEIRNVTIKEESLVSEVVEKNTDSVVSIIANQELKRSRSILDSFFDIPRRDRDQDRNEDSKRDRDQDNYTQTNAGSGFVVAENGFIVTNRHVVDNPDADYTVVFKDGTEIKAEVMDRDSFLDIAIIKIDTQKLDTKPKPASLGDSSSLKVGQKAIAIGNSLGQFSNTVSVGVVSGLGRTIQATDGMSIETLKDLIQTDASINPGNSGGPLFDSLGNVIGVNVAKSQAGENIGFAIPINRIKPILKSVIDTGKIQRPFIGVSYRPITPKFSQKNNLPVDYGAMIVGGSSGAIVPDSPAAKAGLRMNDIILEINKNKITQEKDLQATLEEFQVGDKIKLKILRGDDQKDIDITLESASDFK